MRLGMMESAVVTFYNKIGKSTEPLPIHFVYEFSLLLNTYYLNLVGSLDNIAWALTYFHNLQDDIDEDQNNHRRFVNILGDKFLQKLREKGLQSLADTIQPFNNWYKDTKELRDPAAHRIPLYVPNAIFSDNDIKKLNNLDNDAAELIKNGKYNEGASLLYKKEKLGTHFPIFFSESPTIKCYKLAEQINQDHRTWLDLVKVCLDLGFNEKGS